MKDLRRKARLIVSRYVFDLSHLELYSSVIQLISMRILLIVVAKNILKVVSRNIGNALSHANVLEKVFAIADLEYSKREGYKVEIMKNIHRILTTSKA